jgi:hypothetical protein
MKKIKTAADGFSSRPGRKKTARFDFFFYRDNNNNNDSFSF